jgi:hypothetical protein
MTFTSGTRITYSLNGKSVELSKPKDLNFPLFDIQLAVTDNQADWNKPLGLSLYGTTESTMQIGDKLSDVKFFDETQESTAFLRGDPELTVEQSDSFYDDAGKRWTNTLRFEEWKA